jgi:hypothetical protein
MRFVSLYRSLLRRACLPSARPVRVRTPSGNLGRTLQAALEWDVQHRARRKRLGLE